MITSVVIVDDMAVIRQIFGLILTHSGWFEVVGEGSSGAEAIELAETLKPDIIVLDVEMPGGLTGWQVLPRILEVSPATKAVIVSGSVADDSAPGKQELAAAVLEKGAPSQEVIRLLLSVVGRSEADAEPVGTSPDADAALSSALAQLEKQNRELRRSNDELNSFASIASHDLAQPLQVAYGYLEMLRSEFGDDLDPMALKWLVSATTSLERMRRLIQEILTFARADRSAFVPGPIDLNVVMGLAVTALAPLIAERNAIVEVGDLPVVPGEETQLAQIFQNLIGNGVKYAPAGRVPHVRVASVNTVEGALVSVDDNGDGIPADERERIFEMFHRVHASEISGTGLGLAICRRLVARHGGRIWVEESPLGGARFQILLPILSSEPAQPSPNVDR